MKQGRSYFTVIVWILLAAIAAYFVCLLYTSIFLRKIVPGAADDSYGIEVAKLAGIPDRVITRAREILKELESGAPETAKPAAGPV